jgi:hypothetical protein
MAQAAQQEQERIRQELHDTIFTTFATIKLAIERVLALLHPREHTESMERLQSIRALAVETSQQLRDFLWGTNEDHELWEALCGYLHRRGQGLLERREITFALVLSPSLHSLPAHCPASFPTAEGLSVSDLSRGHAEYPPTLPGGAGERVFTMVVLAMILR